MTAVASARRATARGWGAPRALAAVVVTLLTLAGALLRLLVADQSLFGDELSTHWIVSTHSLAGVVSALHDEIEITPPLSFVLSWLTTRIGLTPELLRAPSLVAGIAAIPLVYAVGRHTVGRAPAVLAAALVALAPFMIYYSAEARAYELMLTFVLLSTLALLAALDTGRTRWWIAYGVCTCAAVYSHYTSVFALAAQLAWVLAAHPQARPAALLANAGALIGFLPWVTGLANDLQSPDTKILSQLFPFTPFNARVTVEHWSIGFPYVTSVTELRDLPGRIGVAALALGLVVSLVGLAVRASRPPWHARLGRDMALVVVMALSAPVGEALLSSVSENLFAARNLAASWPWFALILAAVLYAAGPRVRIVTVGLVLAGFAIGAAKMLDAGFHRPDYRGAGAFIGRTAAPADVVLDQAALFVAPGPLTGLDVGMRRRHRIIRVGVPEQRERNFGPKDPVRSLDDVVRAATTGRPGRIFVVSGESELATSTGFWDERLGRAPGGWRRVATQRFPGFIRLVVLVYDDRAVRRG